MFGKSLFGNTPYGAFFEQMFKEMDRNQRRRKNEEAGVVYDDEKHVSGVPSKNIPSKYSRIDFSGEHYICQLKDETTLYDKRGSFLFTSIEHYDLEKGMYLVKHKGEEFFCLYKGFEKLSKPIFEKGGFLGSKFEADYCALRFQESEKDRGECIVNMDGEVVLEFDHNFSDHISIKNNVAIHKNSIYNLHTGEKICYMKSYGGSLEADGNLWFVQADCEGFTPTTDTKAVYIINTMTCEFQIMGTPPVVKNPSPPPPTKEEIKRREIEAKKPKIVKQGRNDTCQCGSGKKFKNCCIDRVGQILEQKALPE